MFTFSFFFKRLAQKKKTPSSSHHFRAARRSRRDAATATPQDSHHVIFPFHLGYIIQRMEQQPLESLMKQLHFQEALKKQKLKELELIKSNIEVLKLQIQPYGGAIDEKLENQVQEAVKEKYYAVLNGLFPGIYDDWSKAAPHCQGIPGVRHKAYKSKEEAEKAIRDHQEAERVKKGKEIYLGPRTYSETTKTVKTETRTPMKILGKIPSSLEDYPIITRKDHELLVLFSEERFQEYFRRLAEWDEKEKINCFYIVNRKIYGLKAIVTPGATPSLTFNLFQFGLIECLYLSRSMEEINLFPYHFKEAVQNFKKKVAGDRMIYLKFYSVYPDFQTKQPAKYLVFVGICNNNFPLMDEATKEEYSEEKLIQIMANQLASIFDQCQRIGKGSLIKTLYRGPNALLISKTLDKPIGEKDFLILTQYEFPFYALEGPAMQYRPAVLSHLCPIIKENHNHACERCTKKQDAPEGTTSGRQESEGSDEVIIEE